MQGVGESEERGECSERSVGSDELYIEDGRGCRDRVVESTQMGLNGNRGVVTQAYHHPNVSDEGMHSSQITYPHV